MLCELPTLNKDHRWFCLSRENYFLLCYREFERTYCEHTPEPILWHRRSPSDQLLSARCKISQTRRGQRHGKPTLQCLRAFFAGLVAHSWKYFGLQWSPAAPRSLPGMVGDLPSCRLEGDGAVETADRGWSISTTKIAVEKKTQFRSCNLALHFILAYFTSPCWFIIL